MKKGILFLASLALSAFSMNAFSANYYVKTGGTGDGSSWETATTLDDALMKATTAGDVIHIAAGTYLPTVMITGNAGSLKEKTFEIKYNISLIGGYPENATTGAVADHIANPTVLSGDLNASYSAYHVVAITAPVESGKKVSLQGLTIKKTDATASVSSATTNNGDYPRNYGGGIIVAKSTVDVTNCIITDNKASNGAGVYAFSGANITFKNCTIKENSATGNCAGIWNTSSTLYIYDSTISNNNATGIAAGLYIYNTNANFYIHNSTINNNTATSNYAGAYFREGSNGYLVNCTIYGNTSGGNCGAIGVNSTDAAATTLNIISTTITNNTANGTTHAGGIFMHSTNTNNTVKVYNSIVSGNTQPETNSNLTYSKSNTIIGDLVYDADGEEIADESFDATIMLETLADNGGKTQTCLLTGDNNPGKTYGMSSAQLMALAESFTPAIPSSVITFDQIGNNRSGTQTMGAVLKGNNTSAIPVISIGRNMYPDNGTLCIETTPGENISVYSVSGQIVYNQKATGNLTGISGLAEGLYIIKINNQAFKVKF